MLVKRIRSAVVSHEPNFFEFVQKIIVANGLANLLAVPQCMVTVVRNERENHRHIEYKERRRNRKPTTYLVARAILCREDSLYCLLGLLTCTKY